MLKYLVVAAFALAVPALAQEQPPSAPKTFTLKLTEDETNLVWRVLTHPSCDVLPLLGDIQAQIEAQRSPPNAPAKKP